MAGVAEVYLPAFALAIGLPVVSAGLIAAVPLAAGGVLQLLAPRAIARLGDLRKWLVGCVITQALAFVPLIAVALAAAPPQVVVFAAAALFWAAGMAASTAWTPWMARVVPARIRGRFFARRLGVVQAASLVGLLGAGGTLHAFAGTGHVRAAYAVMFGVAMIARLGSAFTLARQGTNVDPRPPARMRFRSIPPRLAGTPRVALLGYLIAAMSAAAISGPFLTPYLLAHEHFGYAAYSVFTAAIVVTKTVALPVLGRMLHRVGVRRMLTASALAIAPIPLLWISGSALPWLLAVQVYSGVAWAGFELGMLMVLFDGNDDAERATMQSAHSALQALGTAGASLVGGALFGALGSDARAYTWVFLVSAIARLAAALLVVRELPLVLARLPMTFAGRAWTLAIRPWGGTIIRPIIHVIRRRG